MVLRWENQQKSEKKLYKRRLEQKFDRYLAKRIKAEQDIFIIELQQEKHLTKRNFLSKKIIYMNQEFTQNFWTYFRSNKKTQNN